MHLRTVYEPSLNRSSVAWCFEHGKAIKICNTIILDFYTRLSQMYSVRTFRCVATNQSPHTHSVKDGKSGYIGRQKKQLNRQTCRQTGRQTDGQTEYSHEGFQLSPNSSSLVLPPPPLPPSSNASSTDRDNVMVLKSHHSTEKQWTESPRPTGTLNHETSC